jgi:hypothetical protein
MSAALLGIAWWARYVTEGFAAQTVTAVGSLLVFSLIMLTWQRESLLRSAASVTRAVPWLNEWLSAARSQRRQAVNA